MIERVSATGDSFIDAFENLVDELEGLEVPATVLSQSYRTTIVIESPRRRGGDFRAVWRIVESAR